MLLHARYACVQINLVIWQDLICNVEALYSLNEPYLRILSLALPIGSDFLGQAGLKGYRWLFLASGGEDVVVEPFQDSCTVPHELRIIVEKR
jgi:hypothetical protein